MDEDLKVLACNYAVSARVCRLNALCFVVHTNPGGGNDRIRIMARSRGGRWIDRWEATWRLHNFRLKTLPPSHPLFDGLRYSSFTDDSARMFETISNEQRGSKLGNVAGLTAASVHSESS